MLHTESGESAVGVAALPYGDCVEIEALARLRTVSGDADAA
ncbi:hypothetical protein [Streptomyces griseoloalbus]|uniref:Uncharacterized protein n=1 Tax=Streptomyces griseoloalbus TaxID=67303 RepID=A0A7W8FAJ7_9ACTN|nr:hypothetical protein [Streptomyces albaduncus]MBB5128252.1 hypothetical protein [Streptomyces albaduncus]GGV82759.1 hypothetical protein GCM10010294_58250 [Streptomyces griseoloalbus]GGW54293.1 hypothetical protein GCM10010340_36070 [Streptomyces albaduncus]